MASFIFAGKSVTELTIQRAFGNPRFNLSHRTDIIQMRTVGWPNHGGNETSVR